MSSPSTAVTASDIDRYILENIPPDEARRAALLRKPNFFREMAENLLVVRSLAREAEEALELDTEQMRWAAEISYQRKLVNRYREKYLQEAFKDVDWDATAKEAYLAQSDLYVRGPSVTASHVLISSAKHSAEEALALIEEVHRKALAGDDFAKLALEYSDDPSAQKNQGNLGAFQHGRMAPAFERAAFNLEKPGDISKPVKTSFGYHVIKLEAKHPSEKIPFEEARPQIIEQLQIQFGDQMWQDKVISVRSDPKLKLNEEALEALEKKYMQSVGADGGS